MTYRLVSHPEGETCAYAAEELWRCLAAMDNTLTEGEGGISLSLMLLEGDHVILYTQERMAYASKIEI